MDDAAHQALTELARAAVAHEIHELHARVDQLEEQLAVPRTFGRDELKRSQPTMSGYWSQVLARARLDFDFYLATKHYGVHHMKVKLGLPNHDIAEQAGWSEAAVEKMVANYAHTAMGALDPDQGRRRSQA